MPCHRRRVGDVLVRDEPPLALVPPDEDLVEVGIGRVGFGRPGDVGDNPPGRWDDDETAPEVTVKGDLPAASDDVELVTETGTVARKDEHEVRVMVTSEVVAPQESRQPRRGATDEPAQAHVGDVNLRKYPALLDPTPDEVAFLTQACVDGAFNLYDPGHGAFPARDRYALAAESRVYEPLQSVL